MRQMLPDIFLFHFFLNFGYESQFFFQTKGVVSRNAFELNLVNRIFYPG